VTDDSMPANWDEPLVKLSRTVTVLCSRTVAGLCGGLVGDADVDALIAATLGSLSLVRLSAQTGVPAVDQYRPPLP
jgi:hypothetical protein